MAELPLWQETALKVRELQVRFDAFETENKISGNYFNEFDEELEEGRVSLEKLEKRVRELETDLPELIAERVATLKTENAELRDHLNVTVDTLNAVVKIINYQVIAREPTEDPDNPDSEDITHPVDRHHYLEEVYTDTQPTLSQVYTMYQSQPSDEEGWNEMTKAIEAAEKYEASLSEQMDLLRKNGTIYYKYKHL